MASSLVLSLSLPDSQADITTNLKADTSSPRSQFHHLKQLFKALACGTRAGSLKLSYADAAPVQASGTFTLVSAIATDKVTIGSIELTATSTPTTNLHWEIDGADDAADAASLCAAINANPTLSKIVFATSAANVVTVTAHQPGVLANQVVFSSADATITASGSGYLAGGAGGAESRPSNYQVG